MLDWLRSVVDQFCQRSILTIELLLPLDGDGAFVGPMAFVFAVEVAERDFLSSAAIVLSGTVVSLIVVVSLAPPSSVAVRPGVAWLFFGDCVDCILVLWLVNMPWLRVQPFAVSCFLLLIHLLDPPPLPAV